MKIEERQIPINYILSLFAAILFGISSLVVGIILIVSWFSSSMGELTHQIIVGPFLIVISLVIFKYFSIQSDKRESLIINYINADIGADIQQDIRGSGTDDTLRILKSDTVKVYNSFDTKVRMTSFNFDEINQVTLELEPEQLRSVPHNSGVSKPLVAGALLEGAAGFITVAVVKGIFSDLTEKDVSLNLRIIFRMHQGKPIKVH